MGLRKCSRFALLRQNSVSVVIVLISQDQFKGRQSPEFYSLELGSLDRLLAIRTRQEGGSVPSQLTQLTDLLVRMEKSLLLLLSSGAPASLVSHLRGQLLR